MAEYKALSFGESFGYKGIMNVKELFEIVGRWLEDHGYDKNEIWNFEEVYEDGKQITYKMEPYKEISDFAKVSIRMTANLKRMKDVTIEKNGAKLKLQRGEADFIFDTFLVTDYEEHWETKPIYFFLKILGERFVYRSYIEKYEEQALKDKDALKREIKSYLNMQKF